MGLSKEVKEILKKIKQRDLAIIEEGFNMLEENEQYLEDLLASVSVNNSTGEIERGKDFKGSKPALIYSDMALFKLLSISRPNSLGEKLRKKIKKIEINVIGIPILNGFDNLEHLNITLTNDRAEFYDEHAWPSDLGEFGKFKNLRFIKISLDRKVASNHRMLSMPEYTKSYVNSLNGLEAPLLENADFKNI